MTAQYTHRPVLLEQAVTALNPRVDGCYVDGTFGRGGHSAALLEQLGEQARLLIVDKDTAAIEHAERVYGADRRCTIRHGSFAQLPEWADALRIRRAIDGILLDLGVSSPQLDDPERGFSFMRDGMLDMRMDRSRGESAAQWLARAPADEIATVLREYGEERFARRIAAAVVEARDAGRAPQTTNELVALIEAAVPFKDRHKHPATRSFQAIRVFVNRELDDLRALLDHVCDLLAPGGRLVVISFHSLEDRIVKRALRDKSQVGYLPPEIAVVPEALQPCLRVVSKPVRATEAEVAENPRARSAIMRIAERLP